MLLYCARPRCNYLLRALPPADTAAYAAGHDDALAACLSRLLAGDGPGGRPALEGAELGELQLRRAQLPLVHGGLGLRAAHRALCGALGVLGRLPPGPPGTSAGAWGGPPRCAERGGWWAAVRGPGRPGGIYAATGLPQAHVARAMGWSGAGPRAW